MVLFFVYHGLMTVNSAFTKNLDPSEFYVRGEANIELNTDVLAGLANSEQIRNTCGEVALGRAANAA